MNHFQESKHLLNNEDMDLLHKEFFDIYNSLEDQSIQSYKNVVSRLFEHTKKHFCYEEELMERFDYPRKKEHIDEHQKVLGEMGYFLKKANTNIGQMMLRSYYKEKIPSWFDLHLISMDSDLSSFIKNKSYGTVLAI